MSGPSKSTHFSSPLLRAGLLGLSLALASWAGPASAGGTTIDCRIGSQASPDELIAACGAILDNNSASRADRVAALIVRADASSRTTGGMNDALADLDRAIALDDKSA